MKRSVPAVLTVLAVLTVALVLREGATGRLAAAGPKVAPVPKQSSRVVLVGDSLMGQVAAATTAALGGPERATYVLTIGTANVKDDWWDVWPRVVAEQRPDAVAVLVGPWEIDRPDLGTLAWSLWYAGRLDRWADALTAGGADLYWILPPSVRDPAMDQRVAIVRDAYRALAARRPGVHLVDADRALTGGPTYEERAPDGERLRRLDGLHLCPLGAEAIASGLLEAMGRRPVDPAWPEGAWRGTAPAYSAVECP